MSLRRPRRTTNALTQLLLFPQNNYQPSAIKPPPMSSRARRTAPTRDKAFAVVFASHGDDNLPILRVPLCPLWLTPLPLLFKLSTIDCQPSTPPDVILSEAGLPRVHVRAPASHARETRVEGPLSARHSWKPLRLNLEKSLFARQGPNRSLPYDSPRPQVTPTQSKSACRGPLAERAKKRDIQSATMSGWQDCAEA